MDAYKAAAILKIGKSTFYRYGFNVKSDGTKWKPQGRRRTVVTDEMLKMAKELFDSGMSKAKVAEEMKIPEWSLRNKLKRKNFSIAFWVDAYRTMTAAEASRATGKTEIAVYRLWNRLRDKGFITDWKIPPDRRQPKPVAKKRRFKLIPYAGKETRHDQLMFARREKRHDGRGSRS